MLCVALRIFEADAGPSRAPSPHEILEEPEGSPPGDIKKEAALNDLEGCGSGHGPRLPIQSNLQTYREKMRSKRMLKMRPTDTRNDAEPQGGRRSEPACPRMRFVVPSFRTPGGSGYSDDPPEARHHSPGVRRRRQPRRLHGSVPARRSGRSARF